MGDPEVSNPPPEGFFRRLCQTAPPALIATDRAFRITSWNPAAARLLGFPAEAMLGRPLESAVPEDRRRVFRQLLDRLVRRRQTSQFEVRLRDSAGKTRNVLVVLWPIPGDSEALEGIAAWLVDETNRRQITRRLARAEKMASLGRLAGGVAHHFNNILAGVVTFVDFALSSGEPAAMRRALQITAEAAAKASKLAQSLLSFAQPDSHAPDLADLTEVVLTFAHLVERPLADRHVALQLDLQPIPVRAVESASMHRILRNLLANAEEAMPNGGTVRLGLRQRGSEVVLHFGDTGCGIRPDHLPLIFEPFFTTKGLLSGGDRVNPGLGLSVMHGLVMQMGGRIDVRSEIGKGAEFDLVLPLNRPES